MAFKAFVFDWDGTLFDSTRHCFEVYNVIFKQFGLRVLSFEDFQREFMADYPKFYLKHGFKEKDLLKVDEVWRRLFAKQEPEIRLVHGAKAVLEKLKEKNLKLALVTNGDGSRVREEMRRHHVHGLFDVVITADDISEFKPSPQGIVIALKSLGVKKHDCLYIGDMVDDAEAGRRAGIKTALVTSGLHSPERLKKAKSDYLFENISRILELA